MTIGAFPALASKKAPEKSGWDEEGDSGSDWGAEGGGGGGGWDEPESAFASKKTSPPAKSDKGEIQTRASGRPIDELGQ
jgi:hypothetical protein